MQELSERQTARQDYIDNAIYKLIKKVNPTNKKVEWDIELIWELRDKIREYFVENRIIADEQQFYPFLEE